MNLVDGIANGKMRGGNVVALQKFLGETLARFQLRSCLARTKDAPAAPSKLIHDPQGQWQLGPDHGQVGTHLFGHRHQRVDIFDIRGQAFGLFGNSTVARSTKPWKLAETAAVSIPGRARAHRFR